MTLAAYECGSVDFPEPPYPDQIVCPQQEAPAPGSDAQQLGVEAAGVDELVGSAAIHGSISLWTIISKVRLEACMWVSAHYTLAVHTVKLKNKQLQDLQIVEFLQTFRMAQFWSQFAVTLHICQRFDQSVRFEILFVT